MTTVGIKKRVWENRAFEKKCTYYELGTCGKAVIADTIISLRKLRRKKL